MPPKSKGIFMSGQTSMLAVLVHAVVFYVVLKYLLPMVGVEGFEDAPTCKTDRDCIGGSCKNGVCVPPVDEGFQNKKKAVGEKCLKNNDCFHGICDSGICKYRFKKSGQQCKQDNECEGLSCTKKINQNAKTC